MDVSRRSFVACSAAGIAATAPLPGLPEHAPNASEVITMNRSEPSGMRPASLQRATLMLISIISIVSCATSSHKLVGIAHPPISPEAVDVYLQAPAYFEEIAEVRASSGISLRSVDDKMDDAIEALKREAAQLGANAILLEEDDDDADTVAYSNTIVTGNISSGEPVSQPRIAVASSTRALAKTVHGLAIYVPE